MDEHLKEEKAINDKTEGRSEKKRKSNKFIEEMKKLNAEKEELRDSLLRKTAEFDNYRKRTEKDFLQRIQNANERLIVELLPALDDMERSLSHSSENDNSTPAIVIDGFQLIYKKLQNILLREGLEVMTSVGDDFNPDKHDALLQIENKDFESGKIVDEHLKGYLLNGKVIRHSQVIVAK